MSDHPRADSLQIDQDLEFQRRSWTAQRWGWAGIALLVLAAIFGFFGSGVASHATLGAETAPLRLEYERFGRWRAPTSLKLHLGRAGESARVWVSTDYVDDLMIEAVTPEPESVEVGEDRLIYTFRVTEGQPATITFQGKPERFGALAGEAGLVDGPSFHFRQYVYP